MISEFRTWTSDGQSLLGIQSYQSHSIEMGATSLATARSVPLTNQAEYTDRHPVLSVPQHRSWGHVAATGRSVPLTNHAEYTDPMFHVTRRQMADSRGGARSDRLNFISDMQSIPPLTDHLTTTSYVSGIRNNFNRRFFLPWLVDPDGYKNGQVHAKSEQINAISGPSATSAPPRIPRAAGMLRPTGLADGQYKVIVEDMIYAAFGAAASGRRSSDEEWAPVELAMR